MNRLFVGFLVCLLFASCAAYMDQPPKAIPADADYLAKALATPLTFSVPNAKADEAWSRINVFISKYSPMKIQIATNFAIETYNPPDGITCAYSASRLQKGDQAEFTVDCFTKGFTGAYKGNRATQNAHILAYYALTGELKESLISR